MKTLLILALLVVTVQASDPAWFQRMDDRERARFDAEWRQLVREQAQLQAQREQNQALREIALALQAARLQAAQQAQFPRR